MNEPGASDHNNGWSGIDLAAVDGFVVENVEAHDMRAFEFAASQVYLPLFANSWDSFGISVVRALESLSSSAIRIN